MECNAFRTQVKEHLVELGILPLAVAELRTASAMDWVSVSRDRSGRFGAAMWAANQAACDAAQPLELARLAAKCVESGFLQAVLAGLKAVEVHDDRRDLNVVFAIASVYALMNLDCESPEVQRMVREAASTMRFVFEMEPPLVFCEPWNLSARAAVGMAIAMFFGRDESGDSFSFSQSILDEITAFASAHVRGESFHAMKPCEGHCAPLTCAASA